MSYNDDDYYQSHQILFGLIFLILFIHQKFHHIEMFFYGIKMRFLMRVYQILEFFNRPSVKLILILVLVALFLLIIWTVLSWIEEKLNQYEKHRAKKLLKKLKKTNPIFHGIYRKPGIFERILWKIRKKDKSFFQSKEFEKKDYEEEGEEDMDTMEDTLYLDDPEVFDEDSEMSGIERLSTPKISQVIKNKTREVMKSQKDQTKKKIKESSFFEDKDILGLR